MGSLLSNSGSNLPAAIEGGEASMRFGWLSAWTKKQEHRSESSFSSFTKTGMERRRHKLSDARSIILITEGDTAFGLH